MYNHICIHAVLSKVCDNIWDKNDNFSAPYNNVEFATFVYISSDVDLRNYR